MHINGAVTTLVHAFATARRVLTVDYDVEHAQSSWTEHVLMKAQRLSTINQQSGQPFAGICSESKLLSKSEVYLLKLGLAAAGSLIHTHEKCERHKVS